MTLYAVSPWPTILMLAGWMAAAYVAIRRYGGRRSLPDPPVFTLLRALSAHVHGVPHYFVEVDDGGLRRRLVIHLAGADLKVLEPNPSTGAARTFPSSRFRIVPSSEFPEDGPGDFRIDCWGTTVEPTVAADVAWLERLGELLLRRGVETCDKPFDVYLRLCGCETEVDASAGSRRRPATAAPPSGPAAPQPDTTAREPETWRVRARRALHVDERGRDGPHYYLELEDGTVLHLNGRGLRALEPRDDEARVFPCDVLEPLFPPRSCLEWPEGVDCLGTAFEPDLGARAVTIADRDEGWVPRDWARLDRSYAAVYDRFEGSPATAPAKAPSSPRPETSEREFVPAVPGRDEEDERREDLAPVDVAKDRSSAREAVRPRTPPGRLVPIQRYAAVRALRVEEKGRHGPHYFVLLDDGAVLHLNGRYLRGYEPSDDRPRVFPCTVFEPTEGRWNMDCIGEPFEPEVACRPIGPEDRATGFVTDDWMLLDRSYEDLLVHFGADPAASTGSAEAPGTARHVTPD